MNKTILLGIAIATAFVIGILSANPVVEAVGGWKAAVADLQDQIDALIGGPVDADTLDSLDSTDFASSEHTHPLVLRFFREQGNVPSVFTTLGPHQMASIDGQLTKFIYRVASIQPSIPPIPVVATVFVNNSPTTLTCDVSAVLNTVVTCMANTPVPVTSTDLISVGQQHIAGGPVVSDFGASVHASIHITP